VLSDDDLIRYGRQIIYPGFGEIGQDKLKASHVLVAGVGGLGCAASMYLTYAGVGHIAIVDDDSVELSNLNRQILHWEGDIGKKKPVSAASKLRRINSGIKITSICKKLTEDNVDEIIKGSDVVIDGLDNFKTRFVLNAACVRQRVPFIHAGVNGLLGQITTIIPGKTPCLACIYSTPPVAEETIPVFGATPAVMASLQVMEAIKLIAGFGEMLEGRMLYFNGESMEFACEDLVKNPKCSVCGSGSRNAKEHRK
jgi:molybdopterin/thiamine biosynthesis adenylyltransferase